MIIRQIIDPHLSQYSYFVGCEESGCGIVIDPERDIDRYYEIAEEEGISITDIAETHIHADFVSGIREFVAKDGSIRIHLSGEGGEGWQSEWARGLAHVDLLEDGGVFHVGRLEFRAMHTPGHTPEHMCFLVTDVGGGVHEPMVLFSGDFIFVGGLGRPDLLEEAVGLEGSEVVGAGELYESVQKLVDLPGHLQVLPGHGAGSSCGKAMSSVPHSTLGYEKKFNPALKLALEGEKDEFIDFILEGQPEPPRYFGDMKWVNQYGGSIIAGLPRVMEIRAEEVPVLFKQLDIKVLDTRAKEDFHRSHLHNSLFTPPERFSNFVGSYVLPEDRVILLVDGSVPVEVFVRQLIRIGFDNIVGYMDVSVFEKVAECYKTFIPVIRFVDLPVVMSEDPGRVPLDVRSASEYAKRYVQNAENIAHTRLFSNLHRVMDRRLLLYCTRGVTAMGASAFLKQAGCDVVCVLDKLENAPSGWVVKGHRT